MEYVIYEVQLERALWDKARTLKEMLDLFDVTMYFNRRSGYL
jgi:hypothetical protein